MFRRCVWKARAASTIRALGAFAGVLAKADLVVLIGKQPDFTLRFGKAPAVAADCRSW